MKVRRRQLEAQQRCVRFGLKEFFVIPLGLLFLYLGKNTEAAKFAGSTCAINEKGVCDENHHSDVWAMQKLVIFENVQSSWGIPQKIYDYQGNRPREIMEKMETYMTTSDLSNDQISNCRIMNENCAKWAAEGL